MAATKQCRATTERRISHAVLQVTKFSVSFVMILCRNKTQKSVEFRWRKLPNSKRMKKGEKRNESATNLHFRFGIGRVKLIFLVIEAIALRQRPKWSKTNKKSKKKPSSTEKLMSKKVKIQFRLRILGLFDHHDNQMYVLFARADSRRWRWRRQCAREKRNKNKQISHALKFNKMFAHWFLDWIAPHAVSLINYAVAKDDRRNCRCDNEIRFRISERAKLRQCDYWLFNAHIALSADWNRSRLLDKQTNRPCSQCVNEQ